MRKTGLIVTLTVVLLTSTNVFAQSKKILFFEAALAACDMTFSDEPTGFSTLAETLDDSGMLVASMSSGEITRDKLSPYDIVVMHPSPERPLGQAEISSLVWYVAQRGGVLFVHGGPARIVNPLTEIFGISLDTSRLLDTSSSLDDSKEGRQFLITSFPLAAGFNFQEVDSISFHGGAPLVLSEDAEAILTGDDDCYSDNGLYSIGSQPPISAVAYWGRGVVLVKSDRSMLSNGNIAEHGNTTWAKAVFDGLASIPDNEAERESSLLGLRARLEKFTEMGKAWGQARLKYEDDLTTSRDKIKRLEKELQNAGAKINQLTEQLNDLEDEKRNLNKRLQLYESPDTLKIAAIAAGVVLLVLFLVGILVGRRTVRSRV